MDSYLSVLTPSSVSLCTSVTLFFVSLQFMPLYMCSRAHCGLLDETLLCFAILKVCTSYRTNTGLYICMTVQPARTLSAKLLTSPHISRTGTPRLQPISSTTALQIRYSPASTVLTRNHISIS